MNLFSSYVYTEIPVPIPTGDEVLMRVDLVSICGSDIALYRWNEVAKLIATVPFIPGHEATGVIVRSGLAEMIHANCQCTVMMHSIIIYIL